MQRLKALVPYLAFVVIFIIFAVTSYDRFVTYRNFSIILQQAAVLAVVAFGMHFVITMGSIDLSVGSVLALSGMVGVGVAVNHGLWGLPVGILVGVAVGLFNGLVYTVSQSALLYRHVGYPARRPGTYDHLFPQQPHPHPSVARLLGFVSDDPLRHPCRFCHRLRALQLYGVRAIRDRHRRR